MPRRTTRTTQGFQRETLPRITSLGESAINAHVATG
jgi:hypothetical protein